MQMRWFVGVVVLVGAAAWFLWGRDGGDAGTSHVGDVAQRAAPDKKEGPTLEASPSAREKDLRGECVILGRVTRDGAPADADVTLHRLASATSMREMFENPAQMLEAAFRLEPTREGVVVASTRTTAGAFELKDLAPGLYRISARDEAGFEAQALAAVMDERPRMEVTLALARPTEALEGRVTWSDGTPVKGRLLVEQDEEGLGFLGLGQSWGPLELDAEGRFRAEGLPAGMYAVRVVTAEGVLARNGRIKVPRKEPYQLTLEALTQTLKGRTISAVGEGAVPGATVIAMLVAESDSTFHLASTTSATDGTFTLATGPLPVKLMAFAAGFAPLEARAEVAEGVLLRLLPHGRVTGRVVAAADGKPVVGAGVVADSGMKPLRTVSGPDGRFEITGVEGKGVRVYVRGGGWASAPIDSTEIGQPGVRDHRLEPGVPLEVVLEAVPSATLEGRVLDAAGAPVVGASVRGDRPFSMTREDVSAVTGADGAFRILDLEPDAELQLQVTAASGARARSGPHRAGGPPVEIRLASGRWVDVTVVFADDGTPVSGANVSLVAHTDGGTHSTGGPQTDAQGRVRVGPAEPGRLGVTVRSEELARGQPETPVEGSDGDARELSVTVRAARALELQGRVLLPDGSPAARANVRVEAKDDEWPSLPNVRTAADGTFRLGQLGAGEHELKAQLEVGERLYRGAVKAVAGRNDVVLRLEDTAKELLTLKVRVLDGQGQPVPRARVQMLAEGSGGDSTQVSRGVALWRTDPKSPLAQALEAGTLVLEASQAEAEDGSPLPWGPAQVGPLGRMQREVEIRLPPELRIEGRVLDPEGKPVAGVRLRVELKELRRGQGFGFPEAQTDVEGRFGVGRLGRETYRVSVEVPPGFLTPAPLVTEPGAAPLEIRLVRGVSARVRVLDAQGTAVVGAQVAVTPQSPSRTRDPREMMDLEQDLQRSARSARTGSDGSATLRGLDPALVWSVRVTPPQGRDEWLPWTQTPWTPADTEVRLEPAFTVEGFVRDASGAPVPEALVYHDMEVNGWQGHLVKPDGSFRVEGLRAGQKVRLSVVGSRGQPLDPKAEPQATVIAGARNVMLTVDPGLTLTVSLDGASLAAGQQVRLLKKDSSGELTDAFHGSPRREGVLLHFAGLPREGLYTVWISPDEAGRYGLERDVRAGTSPVVVRLQQGKTIQGRLTAPEGARDLTVSARLLLGNRLYLHGRLDGKGGYEIRGVPPGPCEVTALCTLDGTYLQARAEAEGGQTLDLVLVAR